MGQTAQGVAYALWRRVEQERVEQGLTKAELAQRASIARSTIDRLEGSKRAPAVATVHALADVLHINRREAEVLAGLLPPPSTESDGADVRTAIARSTAYTEEQRQMLLSMVDTIERANGLVEKSDKDGDTAAI